MALRIFPEFPPNEVLNLRLLVNALSLDERYIHPYVTEEPSIQEDSLDRVMVRTAVRLSRWEKFYSHEGVYCIVWIEFKNCRVGWFSLSIPYYNELLKLEQDTYWEIMYASDYCLGYG